MRQKRAVSLRKGRGTVKTQEKKQIWIPVLVTLSLLLGVGIQFALGYSAHVKSCRAASQAAELLTASLLDTEVRISSEYERLQECMEEAVTDKAERVEKSDLDEIILVNPWNPLPEGYEPELEDLGWKYWDPHPHYLDVSCAESLRKMMDDMPPRGDEYDYYDKEIGVPYAEWLGSMHG